MIYYIYNDILFFNAFGGEIRYRYRYITAKFGKLL